VGCGFGRHSVALAQRGFAVVGIDPAAAMIAAARERAAQACMTLDLQTIPAETFTTETPFDAAICLFTTLGQISERGENSRLAEQVYAALRPSGQFVVEVPQRETAVRQLKTSEQFGGGERYTTVTRTFDAGDNTVNEIFTLVAPEGERVYRLRYRLFSRDELVDLLTEAGFGVTAVYGNYDGHPLDTDSPIIIAIGQKPPFPATEN
jgi:SAM-dependent methyltransferase